MTRLFHLKLDGYPPQDELVFCPRCDYQHPPEKREPRRCPRCETILHNVTAEVVERLRARRAA